MRKKHQTGRCTVCAHPERARIDYLLATGSRHMPLSRKFGPSNFALRRHLDTHISAAFKRGALLGAGPPDRPTDAERSVMDNLRATLAGLMGAFFRAIEAGDDKVVADVAHALHANLDAQAKLVSWAKKQ